jgi:hypothetical protein
MPKNSYIVMNTFISKIAGPKSNARRATLRNLRKVEIPTKKARITRTMRKILKMSKRNVSLDSGIPSNCIASKIRNTPGTRRRVAIIIATPAINS